MARDVRQSATDHSYPTPRRRQRGLRPRKDLHTTIRLINQKRDPDGVAFFILSHCVIIQLFADHQYKNFTHLSLRAIFLDDVYLAIYILPGVNA